MKKKIKIHVNNVKINIFQLLVIYHVFLVIMIKAVVEENAI